jgi:hypothetical protein
VDLGLDWSSVATGVVVGVVVGLILAVVLGAPRWYARRRERKAKEAEARAINRAHLRGGASNVARELRANAEVAKRCEDGYHVSAEAKFVSLIQWKDFKGQIAGLQAEVPELWQELEETYEALEQTKARGANPPPSADLLRLADRLEEAAE